MVCQHCMNNVKRVQRWRGMIREHEIHVFGPLRSLPQTFNNEQAEIETQVCDSDAELEEPSEQFEVIEVQSDEEEIENLCDNSSHELETVDELKKVSTNNDSLKETEKSKLRIQNQLGHQTRSKTPKFLECSTCDRVFKYIKSFQKHVECCNPFILSQDYFTKTKQKIKKENPVQCNACDKIYPSNRSLQDHIYKMDDNVDEWFCGCCELSFSHKPNFNNHINQHYTNPEFKSKHQKATKEKNFNAKRRLRSSCYEQGRWVVSLFRHPY